VAADKPLRARPGAPSSIWAMTVLTERPDLRRESLATRPLTGEATSLSALSVAMETSGWSFVTASSFAHEPLGYRPLADALAELGKGHVDKHGAR
jgi:hypothetical protein